MAFRPFFEIKNVVGDLIGRDLNGVTSNTSNDWVRNNVNPLSFSGNLGQLQQLISTQADSCAAVTKKTGFFTGNNTARQTCLANLNKAYAPVLNELQAASVVEEEKTKQQAAESTQTLYIIAFVAIALILIVLYF